MNILPKGLTFALSSSKYAQGLVFCNKYVIFLPILHITRPSDVVRIKIAMTTNIFAFIIVLGVLVSFHELGHFLAAKLFGVGVEKFSLGFGPRLFGKKVGITDYRVSAIPLGGYVKMVGERPDVELASYDIPFSFSHKHVLKRILIVIAGPLFNLLLAVIIFLGIFQTSGISILKPHVGKVTEKSPAEIAGIQKGDLIVAINNADISSWDKMATFIAQSNGKPLEISVLRNEYLYELKVLPRLVTSKNFFGEDTKRYVIGITASNDYYKKKLNPIEALTRSITNTFNITKLTIIGIAKLIKGSVSSKAIGLGGPIMIAKMSGQVAKEGVVSLLFFIAILSINLAILNCLPIPVLDGGHLLFFFIEFIIGRPVNIKIRERAQQVGMSILLLLMIYVFYSDIVRILDKG